MKKALVTGGTRGIGAGVARSLAAAGWSVIAASASAAELDAAPGRIRTPDPLIRSQVLYPAELPVLIPFRTVTYINSCYSLHMAGSSCQSKIFS